MMRYRNLDNQTQNKEIINEILERTLKHCNKELKKKTESFISLGIQYNLPISKNKGYDEFYIEDFMDNIDDTPIALVGGPGVGKSTLLLKLSTLLTSSYADNESLIIPVFVHFGILNPYQKLKEKIFLPGLSEEEQKYLWSMGKLCIIFDGVNEASILDVDQILKDILELKDEYPKCKYIVSCRTLEFPTWASKYFEYFSVSPVTNEQIFQQFQKILGEEIGVTYYDELLRRETNYLLEVCRTPLLLSMVLRILQENISKNFSLKKLSSKKDIYGEFYKNINKYQMDKNVIDKKFRAVRDDLISTLSFYMQGSNNVFINSRKVETVIRNMKYSTEQGMDYIDECRERNKSTWYCDILQELKKSSFFNLYETEDDDTYYCFIHQSFQEYFAGIYLSHSKGKNQYELIDVLLNTKNKRNWDTLEFACCLDDSDHIIKYMLDYAILNKDPSVLILVSRCILASNQDAKYYQLADDCCIWMLDAFKYWSTPYNYELIYAAQRLIGHTSTDFPERLKRDIYYFSDKYSSGYIATEYPESFDFGYLKDIICKKQISAKLNAIYTLGRRDWPESILYEIRDFLFYLFKNSEVNVREQCIKAIKNLLENIKDNKVIQVEAFISEERMNELICVINDSKESARIRTYTLNTVAEIGNSEAIETFMKYLLNKNNPYRDSASWSLQELLMNSKADSGVYDLKHMKDFYYNCLVSESNDETGMYSKGNLVYTLSKLEATDYVERLKIWLENEEEAYVEEDGINAIGKLAGFREREFLIKYISSDDPVIRSKAYEGLLLVGYEFNEYDKERIRNDRYSIVNMILKKHSYKAADILSKVCLEELMGIFSESMERGKGDEKGMEKRDIGIITILSEEATAVIDTLNLKEKPFKLGQRLYYYGDLQGDGVTHSIIMTQQLSQGEVSVVSAYNDMVEKYNPSIVFLVGIAGGITKNVDYCSVVLGRQIISYDLAKDAEGGIQRRGDVNKIDSEILPLYQRFIQKLAKEPIVAAQNSKKEYIHVYESNIASGSAVIANSLSEIKKWVHGYNDKTDAAEMEAYGVTTAFYEGKLSDRNPKHGVCVVRGISDMADENKSRVKKYRMPAAENAAIILKELIKWMPEL